MDFNRFHCSPYIKNFERQWNFERFFKNPIIGFNITRVINKSKKTEQFPEITCLIMALLRKWILIVLIGHSILKISTNKWILEPFFNSITEINISRIISKSRKTQQF